MTIEDVIEQAIARHVAPLERRVAELVAAINQRQHEAGHWGTRAEAARHKEVSVDTIDLMIKRGELRAERIGPEPKVERFDKKGRRIDRRPVRVWIDGPPKSDLEVEQLAQEARAT